MEIAASDSFYWLLFNYNGFLTAVLSHLHLIFDYSDLDWVQMILIVLLLPKLMIEPEAPAVKLAVSGYSETVSAAGLHIFDLDFVFS